MANSTLRPLKIQKLLAGKSLTGMRLKQIAEALGEHDSTTYRTLQDMIAEGFVTQFEHNDHYALSSTCIAIATAHSLEINQAKQRLDTLEHNVTAHAHQFLS